MSSKDGGRETGPAGIPLEAAIFIYVHTGDAALDARNRLLIAEHGYCFPQTMVVGGERQDAV